MRSSALWSRLLWRCLVLALGLGIGSLFNWQTQPQPVSVPSTVATSTVFAADDPPPARSNNSIPAPILKEVAARAFHLHSIERTGLLIPLYLYPENIHTNAVYNRLMSLKRKYETVPFWVIVNPDSGPGTGVDENYDKAIDRLRGAGCQVLGYVSTRYGQRTVAQVREDLSRWQRMYPAVQGIFFDEMKYEDKEAASDHQVTLNKAARDMGYWPTVANPGAETPERFFAEDCADVIIIHEGAAWPPEARLHGDYFGGYSDYPPWKRAILLHSQTEFQPQQLEMARRYVRWIYVTDDPYRENDPAAANPWDSLSKHMEQMCEALAR